MGSKNFLIFVFIFIFSCTPKIKKADSATKKISENSNNLNENKSCYGDSFVDLEELKKSLLAETLDINSAIEVVKKLLSSLPEAILSKFFSFTGQIRLVQTLADHCDLDPDLTGVYSCWKLDPQSLIPFVYIQENTAEQNTLDVDKSVLNAFALLYFEFMRDYTNENGSVEEIFNEDELINDYLKALEIADAWDVTISPEAMSDLLSFAVTEASCNEESRKNLAESFKQETSLGLSRGLVREVPSRELADLLPEIINFKTDFNLTGSKSLYEVTNILNNHSNLPKKTSKSIQTGFLNEKSQNLLLDTQTYKDMLKNQNIKREPWNSSMIKENVEKNVGFKYYTGEPRFICQTNRDTPVIVDPKNIQNGLDQKKPITIMIHGTFSATSILKEGKWGDPRGHMADSLRSHYGGDVLTMQWSGKNSSEDRTKAAEALKQQIIDLRLQGFQVNLVSHSHGGSVAIEALNKLPPEVQTKGEFVALARPVRDDYSLNKAKVSYYTTATGEKDFIQIAGGFDNQGSKLAKRYDESADLMTTIQNGNHNAVKKAALSVIEYSRQYRLEEIKANDKIKSLCETKCRAAFGIGVVGISGVVVGGALVGSSALEEEE